jgi:opacity protein-like surface antigen
MAGYEFNQYTAIEGRYSTYIVDSDGVETDTWGIYLKPQYPVNEDFKVYALLGFGGVTIDGVRGSSSIDEDDTSFQWGLGASYVVAEDIAIFLDYAKLMEDMDADTWRDDIDVDAITLGVTYNF